MKIIKNVFYFRIGIFLLIVFLCSCTVSHEPFISNALEETETTTQSVTAEATSNEEKKRKKLGSNNR